MQPKNKISYSPAAVDDMDEIFSYITGENAPAADSMLRRLDESILKLADFPNMGSMLSEDDYSLLQRGYRFIVVGSYLIFYRIVDDTIIIHRILHGRRDYLRELFSAF